MLDRILHTGIPEVKLTGTALDEHLVAARAATFADGGSRVLLLLLLARLPSYGIQIELDLSAFLLIGATTASLLVAVAAIGGRPLRGTSLLLVDEEGARIW